MQVRASAAFQVEETEKNENIMKLKNLKNIRQFSTKTKRQEIFIIKRSSLLRNKCWQKGKTKETKKNDAKNKWP